jgi:hypothetical protein
VRDLFNRMIPSIRRVRAAISDALSARRSNYERPGDRVGRR